MRTIALPSAIGFLIVVLTLDAPALHAQNAGKARSNEDIERPAPGRRTPIQPAAPPRAAPSSPASPAPVQPIPSPVSSQDSQAFTLTLTACQLSIENARVAQQKAKDPTVKQFASQTAGTQSEAARSLLNLASRLKIGMQYSDATNRLRSKAGEEGALLRRLSGAELDNAYLIHEVMYHQAVLDEIDKALPNPRNADVKAAMQNTRVQMAAELQQLKRLQIVLTGAK
jgi:putative membrane protein